MAEAEIDVDSLREELSARFRADPLESTAIALDSLRFTGWQYRMSRELYPGYIDCSTIVSQAYWDAAGVQTPFIAESQRLAYSAISVPDIEQALPGDVLVSYRSLADSPNRDHNHVALLLTHGRAQDGFAIEARPEGGARVIRLEQASWAGGIRRFGPNPLTPFPADGPWHALAVATPKIARLGARLIAHYRGGDANGPARRHRGIDVYAAADSAVVAPIGGTVTITATGEGRRWSVAIRDEPSGISTLLAPVVPASGIRTGDAVARGDYLGELDTEHRWYGCNALVSRRGQPYLHWELWSTTDLGYAAARGIVTPERELAEATALPYNPIYAVKLGTVGSPVKCDVARVVGWGRDADAR